MFYKLALLLFLLPHLTYGLACEKPFAKRNKYVSYEEVRQYAIKNKIKSPRDWKSREHPAYIPKHPYHYFARRGQWKSWYHFLSTKTKFSRHVPYKQARQYAIKNNVKGVRDWRSLKLPPNFPKYPDSAYGIEGKWTSWHDFLGKKKMSYKEVQKYAQANQIKTSKDWKSREHPDHIPKKPDEYFKRQGEWKSWYDFLGKKKKGNEYRRRAKVSNIFILPPLGAPKRKRP